MEEQGNKRKFLKETLATAISLCEKSYQRLELFGALYEANDAKLIQSHVRDINFEGESFTEAGMYAMSSVMRRCGQLDQVNLAKCRLNSELLQSMESNLKNSGLKVKPFYFYFLCLL